MNEDAQHTISGTPPRTHYNDFSSYTKAVKTLTARTYREYQYIINPDNLLITRADISKAAHHLDHIVSKRTCFDLSIPPALCSSVDNLRVITYKDNQEKYSTLTEDGKEILAKWGFTN